MRSSRKAVYLFIVFGLIATSGCGGSSAGLATYGGSTPTTGVTPATSSTLGTSTLNESNPYLVDGNGRTLFQASSPCTGSCLTVWPPFTASQIPTAAGSAVQGSIGLSDGQVTYNGQLLYYFESDTSPGQTSNGGNSQFSLVVSP
jgi:predicted lipoprotein with Yx(FWY)xxD motif